MVVAAMWIVFGVLMMVGLHASWRFVPGIVSIGIGLLYLRAAAATVVRRQDR